MKNLIIIRHGTHNGSSLNGWGEVQMEIIAREIKMVSKEENFTLLASSAERAVQSAEVIGKILNVELDSTSEKFWSDETHRQNNNEFQQALNEKIGKAENVIIVTHLEYAKEMPYIFTENFPVRANKQELWTGSGIIINFEMQKFDYIYS